MTHRRLVYDDDLTVFLGGPDDPPSLLPTPRTEESVKMGVKHYYPAIHPFLGRSKEVPIPWGYEGYALDPLKCWRDLQDATADIERVEGVEARWSTHSVFETRWVEYVTRWTPLWAQLFGAKHEPQEFGVEEQTVLVGWDVVALFEAWETKSGQEMP